MTSITILMSGLPGSMAREIVETADAERPSDFQFAPTALSAPNEPGPIQAGRWTFELAGPGERESLEFPEGTLAVDFTQPDAALGNIEYFVAKRIPFVMGTTGFDMAEAHRLVEASSIPAVIAPNMATPIVLLQMAVEYLAENFPGAMDGYNFQLLESHQSTKKDTSGTAKALAGHFAKLGLPASVDAIEKVRDPDRQRADMGVPDEHLGGHAYHYYTMRSEAGDVDLRISHCVNGRRVYARGVLTAVEFLSARAAEGREGVVYSMENVLRKH